MATEAELLRQYIALDPLKGYIARLVELHILALHGKNDSPEADLIRDGMDRTWYSLTEGDRIFIGFLSEQFERITAESRKENA